jgi:hypothetical protein
VNKRALLSLATILLLVGVVIIFSGIFGQFFAGAETASSLTKPELSTVQSFIIFGGSMVATSFVLFVLLNRLG